MNLSGFKAVAGIATQAARERIQAAIREGVRQVVFGIVMAIFVLMAIAFGLATLTVWLADELGTIPALGIMAIGFLVLTLIVYIMSRATAPRKTVPPRHPQPTPAQNAAAFVKEELDAENPPTGSALGALTLIGLVGFTLARQIFKR